MLQCMHDFMEQTFRFCPDCKNDTSGVITAGEKLKMSKKKSKMMSNINKDCTRDWGKVSMLSMAHTNS